MWLGRWSPLGFVTSVSEHRESSSEQGGRDGTCPSLLQCFWLRKLECKTVALAGESCFISVSVDQVVGESGSSGSSQAWFVVEGVSDGNINVDMFHKVNTKQELHTVD